MERWRSELCEMCFRSSEGGKLDGIPSHSTPSHSHPNSRTSKVDCFICDFDLKYARDILIWYISVSSGVISGFVQGGGCATSTWSVALTLKEITFCAALDFLFELILPSPSLACLFAIMVAPRWGYRKKGDFTLLHLYWSPELRYKRWSTEIVVRTWTRCDNLFLIKTHFDGCYSPG